MAMTAKTKAERVKRLEARIEKIRKQQADLLARQRSLDEDRDNAVRELEWIKGAPVSDAQPDEPVFTPVNEPQVVVNDVDSFEGPAVSSSGVAYAAPAASPAEVAGVAEVATATQHL